MSQVVLEQWQLTGNQTRRVATTTVWERKGDGSLRVITAYPIKEKNDG